MYGEGGPAGSSAVTVKCLTDGRGRIICHEGEGKCSVGGFSATKDDATANDAAANDAAADDAAAHAAATADDAVASAGGHLVKDASLDH